MQGRIQQATTHISSSDVDVVVPAARVAHGNSALRERYRVRDDCWAHVAAAHRYARTDQPAVVFGGGDQVQRRVAVPGGGELEAEDRAHHLQAPATLAHPVLRLVRLA